MKAAKKISLNPVTVVTRYVSKPSFWYGAAAGVILFMLFKKYGSRLSGLSGLGSLGCGDKPCGQCAAAAAGQPMQGLAGLGAMNGAPMGYPPGLTTPFNPCGFQAEKEMDFPAENFEMFSDA